MSVCIKTNVKLLSKLIVRNHHYTVQYIQYSSKEKARQVKTRIAPQNTTHFVTICTLHNL